MALIHKTAPDSRKHTLVFTRSGRCAPSHHVFLFPTIPSHVQGAAVTEVIKGASVIASTLTGLLHPRLEREAFDIVIIDEAAQVRVVHKDPFLKGSHGEWATDVIAAQVKLQNRFPNLGCIMF